jgi:uncharacterized coiled-coil protein SlyX
MDTLQKQITHLSTKVDSLHQVIEQLNVKVSEVLSDSNRALGTGMNQVQPSGMSSRYYSQGLSAQNMGLDHKDVLSDTNSLDASSSSSERELAPEIQIRRLTAQLTAAYNRIAALEEQLLAHRLH